jgi:hypothetical protein
MGSSDGDAFLAEAERTNRIANVRFDDERMYLQLHDSREVSVPLWWYPRLLRAAPEQRANFEIGRFGVHWPEVDEDIELGGLLLGAKAPGATPPVEA